MVVVNFSGKTVAGTAFRLKKNRTLMFGALTAQQRLLNQNLSHRKPNKESFEAAIDVMCGKPTKRHVKRDCELCGNKANAALILTSLLS